MTSNANGRSDLEQGLLARQAMATPDSLMGSPMQSRAQSDLTRRASSVYRETIDQSIPIEVRLDHVDYFVNDGKKQIIHDVSLTFKPGRLSCMMGPSGSGKTTCLSLILGHASGEIRSGSVLVNNERGPPQDFKSVAKLIPQEDILLPSFSVYETLNYHAQLVLPQKMSSAERKTRIEAVIKSLGLSECADTRVGSVDQRGISGGQRKRTSIACELLSNPCVLCVDEPTSGLDSSSAEVVVQILKDLCSMTSKRTVITTIHQPSYRIFSLFDDITLLTKGRVAYHGPMKNLEEFFLSIGHDVPPKENPADHFMRLLQDPELAFTIPTEFAKRRGKEESASTSWSTTSTAINAGDSLKTLPRYPTSHLHQIQVLIRRQSMDFLKDPQKFLRMMGVKAAVGVMVGTVWWKKADPPRQSELFAVQGALFLLVMNGIIETLAMTIISFPLIRSLLIREYKNGSYSVLSFYVANILSQGAFGIFFVLTMAFPVYFMVGFQFTFEKFGVFLLAMILTTMIGNALGVAVGASAKDLIEAQNLLAPLLAPIMLFSGYVIPKNQIPNWALPFYYVSFFQYAIALYQINCFTGMVFSDFKIDIFHPTQIRPLKTGEQFLQAIGLDPETHHVKDYLLILTGYAVGITFLGYFLVKRAVNRKYA